MSAPISRRQFMKFSGSALLAASLSGVGTYAEAGLNQRDRISVERVEIPICSIREGLDGFRIVQMSDLHLHPFTQIEFINSAVRVTNALKPDLVVLTGDYVTKDVDTIFELSGALSKLNPRLGVFAVAGNHDIQCGSEVVQMALEKVGISLLKNTGVSIGIGRQTLLIAGLDDARRGRPDLNAALEKQSGGMPAVVLVHEPDYADRVLSSGRVALQLSGHSHGGQVRLPGVGAFFLPRMGRKYDLGLYRINGSWLYTNRGLGLVNVPLRVNCPPEITELTLCAA